MVPLSKLVTFNGLKHQLAGTWLAHLVEHMTFDIRVKGLRHTLGIEINLKIKSLREKQKRTKNYWQVIFTSRIKIYKGRVSIPFLLRDY